MLMAALVDSGGPVTTDDREAVADSAALDPDTVEAVTRWIRRGKPIN